MYVSYMFKIFEKISSGGLEFSFSIFLNDSIEFGKVMDTMHLLDLIE